MPNSLLVAPASRPAVVVAAGVWLRRLDEDDLPAVGEAYRRTYAGTPHAMTLAEATDDVDATWRGAYGRWLRDGSWGAWRAGALVGAVLTVEDPPWDDVPPGPFVVDLFVVPGARRCGTGRALVATVQRQLGRAVGLRVDDAAVAARALYASLGFRAVAPA